MDKASLQSQYSERWKVFSKTTATDLGCGPRPAPVKLTSSLSDLQAPDNPSPIWHPEYYRGCREDFKSPACLFLAWRAPDAIMVIMCHLDVEVPLEGCNGSQPCCGCWSCGEGPGWEEKSRVRSSSVLCWGSSQRPGESMLMRLEPEQESSAVRP